jgi:hypothetical protein
MADTSSRAPTSGSPAFHSAPTDKRPDYVPPPDLKEGPKGGPQGDKPRGFFGKLKAWAKRHHTALWFLHSFYALALGVMVMLFAAKGFAHARVLAATLGAAFLVTVILFRFFGHGKEQKEKVAQKASLKLRFLGMTYVLKNLYQGMLFFVLPFYWKSSSLDSINAWFVVMLATFALLSTMDLVFDHVLMRYKAVAAVFYGITLFACCNLIIPAFFDNVPTLVALLVSAVLATFGFWLLHFPIRELREKRTWGIIGMVMLGVVAAVYFARMTIPPVPLYVVHQGVGMQQMTDGQLKLEVVRVHKSLVTDLYALSEVALPGGEGDTFEHIWRLPDGTRVPVEARTRDGGAKGQIRLVSSLPKEAMPANPTGEWRVDTMTAAGQIVGRTRFMVIE